MTLSDRVPTKAVGAAARGDVRDESLVRSGYWAVVIALVVVMLAGTELLLRMNVVWRLPVEYLLLGNAGDLHTKATWLVHRPPAPDGNEVIVLGSSTAAAIAELPGNESQSILRDVLARPELRLISLTNSSGCYPDHLTLLENAFEHGHHPTAVILISWPECLGPYDETDALLARRMPLVSSSLLDLEAGDHSVDIRLQARLVRASAVQRYRYAVNAWLRSRWRGLLRGRAPWAALTVDGYRRVSAWKGPWDLDRERYERLRHMPGRWANSGRASRQLARLLDLSRDNGVPVIIVESPWSPPVFDVLGDEADRYSEMMKEVASQGGAILSRP